MRDLRNELRGVGNRLEQRLKQVEKGMAKEGQVDARKIGREVREEVKAQTAPGPTTRITGSGRGPTPARIPDRDEVRATTGEVERLLSAEARLGVQRARNLQILQRQIQAMRAEPPRQKLLPPARSIQMGPAGWTDLDDAARRVAGGGGGGGGAPPPPAPPGGGEPPDRGDFRKRIDAKQILDNANAQNALANAEAAEAAQVARVNEARSSAAATLQQMDSRMQEATRTLAINSNALRAHGALTTEFITAAAKGQTTMRELGFQVGATIGKFGGWTAAAAAVYGVLGAVQQLGTGAVESLQGVNLLERVVNNVDTEQAQRNFRELAHEFNLPLGTVVATYYEASKAFKDQADALSATRAALFGVKVGELDAAKAGQFATAVVRGFHLEASQLGDVIDTVNGLQNRFGGNFGQIAQGMAQASGAFGAARGQYQDLAAAIQTISQVTGIPGANAATGLRRTAEVAFRPERRANILEVLGVDTRDATTSITDLIEAAQRKVEEGANPLDVAKLITTPELASRSIAPLLASGGLFRERQAVARSSQGSAEREKDRAVNSFRDTMSKSLNELQILGSNLGQAGALDAFGGLLKTVNLTLHEVNQLLELFNELPKPVRQAMLYMGQLAGILAVMRRFDVGASVGSRFPALGGALGRRPFQANRAQVFQGLEDERKWLQGQLEATGRQRAFAEFQARTAAERHGVNEARHAAGEIGDDELTASHDRMVSAKNRAVELQEQQTDLIAHQNENVRKETAIRERTTRRSLRGLSTAERGEAVHSIAYDEGVQYTNPTLNRNVPVHAVVIGQDGKATLVPVNDVERAADTARAAPRRPPIPWGVANAGPINVGETRIDRVGGPQWNADQWAMHNAFGDPSKAHVPLPGEDWRRMNERVDVGAGAADVQKAEEVARKGNFLRDNIRRQTEISQRITREFTRNGQPMSRLSTVMGTVGGAAQTMGKGATNVALGARAMGASLLAAIDPLTAVLGGFLILEASYSYIKDKIQQSQRTVAGLDKIGTESPAQLRAQAQRELDQKSLMDRAQGGFATAFNFLTPGAIAQSPDQAEDAAAKRRAREADVIERANRHGVGLTRGQISQRLNERLTEAGTDQRKIAEAFAAAGREADVARGIMFASSPADLARAKHDIEAYKEGLKSRRAALKAVDESIEDALKLAFDPAGIAAIFQTTQTNIALHGFTPQRARDLGAERARAIQNLANLDRGDPDFEKNRQADLATIQGTEQEAISRANERMQRRLPYADPDEQRRIRMQAIRNVRRTLLGGPEAKVDELRARMLRRQSRIAALREDLEGPADPASASGAGGFGAGGLGQLPGGAAASEEDKAKRYRAMKAAQENDKKALEELRRQMGVSREAFEAFLKEQQLAQFQADAAAFEQTTSLLQSRTADSSRQAAIAASRAQTALAATRDAHRRGIVPIGEVQKAEEKRNQTQQALAQDAIKDAQANDELATARAQAGGLKDKGLLQRQLNDALRNAARVKAGVASGQLDPDAYRDAMKAVYDAQTALNNFVKTDSDSLINAMEALALSRTEDPIKQASIRLNAARQRLTEARAGGDREAIINAQADVNNKVRDKRNTIQQRRFDAIEFDAQMETIGKQAEISRLQSLLATMKGNEELKRQIRLRIHELKKSTSDLSSEDLTLGNIRLPTPYEVNRAIKEGGRAARGSVNMHAQVSVGPIYVANNEQAERVVDSIHDGLASTTRSSLRAAGSL